ncbi:hypothetical protein CDAR_554081 [Caerostris darwini]|uniref:Uncharacterized protein n=1 Tax=Caerostris darwini TaxID=1538125 RepID=A0AAV4X5L2_9ARAC|nr:hypothetical protein CDAR_554081 [Caerostris darwini]
MMESICKASVQPKAMEDSPQILHSCSSNRYKLGQFKIEAPLSDRCGYDEVSFPSAGEIYATPQREGRSRNELAAPGNTGVRQRAIHLSDSGAGSEVKDKGNRQTEKPHPYTDDKREGP